MELAGGILVLIGKIILWVWLVVVVGVVVWWVWFRKTDYNKAREEIFVFVKSYKRRCTGANRFEVTISSLQDSFREYDTLTINKVWLDLIKEHVIEQDPQDGEWVVR